MGETDARFENARQAIERWDAVFRALSAEPRRQLVVSLSDAPPEQSVPLPESAMNRTVPREPDRLRIDLRHNHLPTLAESGFVDWETEPLAASRGPRFREIAAVCEALQASSPGLPEPLVLGCQRLEEERQQR